MVVPYMYIIHMQSHSNCTQYANEYGKVIEVYIGSVFEYSPFTSGRKYGGTVH